MGEINLFEIILFVVILGLVVSYFFGWISFGNKVSATPTENELPQTSETQENETSGETLKFQQCTIASDCNWDQTKYYNRNCEFGGNWRCMSSPVVGESLCSYGCYLNDTNGYCGDGICAYGGLENEGVGFESEWTCQDCDKSVAFIGNLVLG